MELTREHIEVTPNLGGKYSPAGWLVVDLKGLNLEGETHLVLDLVIVERLKAQPEVAERLAEQLRREQKPGPSLGDIARQAEEQPSLADLARQQQPPPSLADLAKQQREQPPEAKSSD